MAAVTDRERAIDTLQRLYDYARIEASAMQKIQQRVNSYARNLYMHDVTTAKEATI